MKKSKQIGINGIKKKLLINNDDYRRVHYLSKINPENISQKLKNAICKFKDINNEEGFILSLINHLEFGILQKFTSKFNSKEEREKIIEKYLMRRCSNQILNEGYFIGCSDLAIVVADSLRVIGYCCEFIFTVSEYFANNNNQGHTFIYAKNESKSYLIDVSLKCLYDNYRFQKEFYINSIDGNLLIIGRTDIPNKIGLSNKTELTELRKLYFFNHKFFQHGFISQKRAKTEIG